MDAENLQEMEDSLYQMLREAVTNALEEFRADWAPNFRAMPQAQQDKLIREALWSCMPK